SPGSGDDLHEYGVEASRPWRGAATWAALKSLGRAGVADLVTRSCAVARELAALVESTPRLELTAPAATCVVCFRYRPGGWADRPASAWTFGTAASRTRLRTTRA